MKLSFAEQIQYANVLLHENEVEKSIENYQEALSIASTPEQKLHLNNVLGRLYQRTKNPDKAMVSFENSLALMETNPGLGTLVEKASIVNNVAAILSEKDSARAIDEYKKALAIYTEILQQGKKEYEPHFANTQFALAEVYARKRDYYFAKKYYKEAIKVYEGLNSRDFLKLRASAHYQLGNIYTEEFNLFDAKVHYLKAQKLFEGLIGEGEEALKPYLAAVLNNLAVTFNSMEEPEKSVQFYNEALKAYQELSDLNYAIFQPYVASTFNSIGIVHSEMGDFDKAIQNIIESVNRYNDLADARPSEFTHYLATGLHNLGLFHFELRDLERAQEYFRQALDIRTTLANEQPEEFDADFCATSLNLVELYQSELENKVDFSFKERALELLSEVELRLKKYGSDLPVLKNMKNDCEHYLNYFNDIQEEDLSLHHVLRKVNHLKDQIDETIYPSEKIVFQNQIMELLQKSLEKYTSNDRLKQELMLSHVNLSWLHLRLKDFGAAEQTLLKVPQTVRALPSLTCNYAHCLLIQGDFTGALQRYKEISTIVNDQNESYKSIILKDFEILKRDGIACESFEMVVEQLD
ncbi:tetratricopeptide repeat protein [Flagellimonas okinawensis]|uniref:Tetratricopeptide repeat protein n=1 Tax=Flagellimonas okinawensis TaxID=3031324 RepID=A0ABT5XLG6_9FLAO|nr:tetratricopeptide repeat protein [[Muricauda] okinawensis]MDF0706662.1 tetratricopeptide repeat protein [[Muricauda] okinawensis]